MNVSITDSKSGVVVAVVPVALWSLNSMTVDLDYIHEAWRTAVEDGIVDPDERENFEFILFR